MLPLHTLRSVSPVSVVHAYRHPKFTHLDPPSADYEDLSDKPFFPGLIKYMASGPVVAMVWQGLDAVKTGRAMLGATNPLASAPGSLRFMATPYLIREFTLHLTGTIRGDFCLAVGRNICHGSDSVENAEKEIKL